MQKQSAIFIMMLCLSFAGEAGEETLTDEQQLGRLLYKDKNLSLNRNQSCASCHSLRPVHQRNNFPALVVPGFVHPENAGKGTAVAPGSIPGATGSLNTPSVGYAAFSPLFHQDEEGLYIGGQFWNGRARNLIEQAKRPFLNPVEMAMPSERSVVSRLRENERYRKLFWQVYRLDLAAVPYIKAYIQLISAIFRGCFKGSQDRVFQTTQRVIQNTFPWFSYQQQLECYNLW